MTRMPAVTVDELVAAYHAWPDAPHDKAKLYALLLRVRVERLAASLPPTIIAAAADSTRLRQRLMLTIGAPDLTAQDQNRRFRIVTAALAAHGQICDLLHGRNPESNPHPRDVGAWTEAINELEAELASPVPPQPRRIDH